MTELDAFLAMLRRTKIDFERNDGDAQIEIIIYGGYVRFFSQILFTSSGQLLSIKAYE